MIFKQRVNSFSWVFFFKAVKTAKHYSVLHKLNSQLIKFSPFFINLDIEHISYNSKIFTGTYSVAGTDVRCWRSSEQWTKVPAHSDQSKIPVRVSVHVHGCACVYVCVCMCMHTLSLLSYNAQPSPFYFPTIKIPFTSLNLCAYLNSWTQEPSAFCVQHNNAAQTVILRCFLGSSGTWITLSIQHVLSRDSVVNISTTADQEVKNQSGIPQKAEFS